MAVDCASVAAEVAGSPPLPGVVSELLVSLLGFEAAAASLVAFEVAVASAFLADAAAVAAAFAAAVA